MIYLAQLEGQDRIKIGKSNNVKKRIARFQTGCPWKLIVCHTIDADDCDLLERGIHHLLREFNVHGEWFDISAEEAIKLINSVGVDRLSTIGVPDSEPPFKINEKLLAIFKASGLSCYKLGQLSGVDKSTIQRWKNGNNKLSCDSFEAIAKALGKKITIQ